MLQTQPNIVKEVGLAAYNKVKDRKIDKFIQSWNEVFTSTLDITYMR